ncbi:MAG TPA: TetR family transcriptional regulator C-terminal domain-containing protein, partial [candidate division Zixibacteria bacterium]|nr:TetR family transcriptional regulator C-terminal domain-containing protein [candidate division Zixibacteria bacterium]
GTVRLQNGDYTAITDPVQRLLGYLDHCEKYAETFWGDGCLLGNFSTELAQTHPRIRERVAEIFTRLTHSQAKLFEPALRAAGIGNSPTANELSEHLLATIEGGIVLGRAYGDPRHITGAIDQFRRYIKELLK